MSYVALYDWLKTNENLTITVWHDFFGVKSKKI